MKRFATLVWLTAFALTASVVSGDAESPVLRKATLDPARRARIALWWNELEAARPAFSAVTRELRRERERWRGAVRREGCHRARDELAGLDRPALLANVDYFLILDLARALDEFDGAATACLEKRYFEFDYRLQTAETALESVRRRASEQLTR
jgi:hypothetical protein